VTIQEDQDHQQHVYQRDQIDFRLIAALPRWKFIALALALTVPPLSPA